MQPEAKPEDAEAVAKYLRALSDAELSQVVASPGVLVDRLPGFTLDQLRTGPKGGRATRSRCADPTPRCRDLARLSRRALIVPVCA
jgi:hypothetical protein